jgi:hypothetical protein
MSIKTEASRIRHMRIQSQIPDQLESYYPFGFELLLPDGREISTPLGRVAHLRMNLRGKGEHDPITQGQ